MRKRRGEGRGGEGRGGMGRDGEKEGGRRGREGYLFGVFAAGSDQTQKNIVFRLETTNFQKRNVIVGYTPSSENFELHFLRDRFCEIIIRARD
jgi:hypothetical protein